MLIDPQDGIQSDPPGELGLVDGVEERREMELGVRIAVSVSPRVRLQPVHRPHLDRELLVRSRVDLQPLDPPRILTGEVVHRVQVSSRSTLMKKSTAATW